MRLDRDDTMTEADELTVGLAIMARLANRLYDGEPVQANLVGALVSDINAARDRLIEYKAARRRWLEDGN